MSMKTEELKDRIEARQRELQAHLAELRADARQRASEEAENLQRTLDDLRERLRTGWDNLTEAATEKLNDWLHRSERHTRSGGDGHAQPPS